MMKTPLEVSTVVADVHECIVKNGLPCRYSTLREYLVGRHHLPCERTLQRAMAQLGLAKCYFSPRGSLFDRGSSIPQDPVERRAKYAKFLQDAACESACDSEPQTAEDSPDDASVQAASCASLASASVEDTRDAQLEEVLSGQSKTRDTINRLEAEKAELLKLAQRSYRLKCEIAELRKQALRDLTKIAAMVYADEDDAQ